jgi:hypothetical protein
MIDGKSNPEIAKRIALCGRCVHLIPKVNVCKKCGCFMPAKTRLTGAKCPIGKWDIIVTDKPKEE